MRTTNSLPLVDENVNQLAAALHQRRHSLSLGIGHWLDEAIAARVLMEHSRERCQCSSVDAVCLGKNTFAAWARAVGAKIADETIDPDAVLAGTLKPKPVGTVPAVTAIAVDWPNEVLERPETGCRFSGPGIAGEPSTNVGIEVLAREPADPLLIACSRTDGRAFCVWISDR